MQRQETCSHWSVIAMLACVTQTAIVLSGCSGPLTAKQSALTASSKYAHGDVRTINIPGTQVQFNMVFVQAGKYEVGSPETEEGRSGDEGPRHNVALSGYWIGQLELTDEEYAVFRYPDRDADTTAVPGAVYSVDGVSRPSPPYEDPAFGMGGSGKPAVGMTQWGALHYAHWLTEKTGIFFRLPTEAEWETACRAGSDDIFGFGDDASKLTNFAWNEANSSDKLQNVGEKEPNPWGLFDMHGNAAEWTMDEYQSDYYSSFDTDGAIDPWSLPTRLHPRTVRGGSFYDGASDMRCATRLESTLNWKRRDPQIPKSFWWNTDAPFLGFRLVAPEQGMSAEDQIEFWTLVLGE
jgi:formylglycine-generating enzyme required for sulfatase activity